MPRLHLPVISQHIAKLFLFLYIEKLNCNWLISVKIFLFSVQGLMFARKGKYSASEPHL